MAIQGKQIADNAITTAKIGPNAVTSAKVDSTVLVAGGTNALTADWNAGSFKITGLADPTNPQDAATKNYVDSTAQGLDIKASMRVATAAALPANSRSGNVLTASANGALNGTGIDGVTSLAVNDRVLVKDEATAANNGLYFVSDLGSAGTPWTLTRSTDADTSAKVTAGLFTFIEEGTSNDNTGWVLSTNNPITLNSTALTFVQFSGAGAIIAGNGLTKTGNTIDLVIETNSGGLTANPNDLQINYASAGTLVAVDAAAASAGTSQLLPRADHKHSISTAAAGTIAVGDAAAAGTATTLARSDHTHALPAPAAPADVTKAAASAGASTTVARADHKHDVSTATPAAGAVAAGNTAAEGTATSLARSDHQHAVSVAAPVDIGTANAAGAATTFVRSDHVHNLPFTPVQTALGAASGAVSFNSQQITNVTDPTNPQDAATKAYVDGAIGGGSSWKLAVRAATTANITLSGAQTIDGVSVVAGNRVLVKDQSTASDNGIYVAAAGAWARASDASSSSQVTTDMTVFVSEGTVNGTYAFYLSTIAPITLGSTSLAFARMATNIASTAPAAVDNTAAAVGTSNTVARSDHKHAVNVAAPVAGAVAAGNAAATGSATTLALSDHQHAVSVAAPVDVGSANAAGAATTFVRSDHVHRVPRQITSNKQLTASVTTVDNDQATATTVAASNALGGYVGVRVNGIHYFVGDGTKVAVDCYFSGDGGTTARAMSAIVAGDTLHWNGSVAGFQLATTDRIDFLYEAF